MYKTTQRAVQKTLSIAGASDTTGSVEILAALTETSTIHGRLMALTITSVATSGTTTATYTAVLKRGGTTVKTIGSTAKDLTTAHIENGNPSIWLNTVGDGPLTLDVTLNAAAGSAKTMAFTIDAVFEQSDLYPIKPHTTPTQVEHATINGILSANNPNIPRGTP